MPAGFSIYDTLTENWMSKNNLIGKDFNIYSTEKKMQ